MSRDLKKKGTKIGAMVPYGEVMNVGRDPRRRERPYVVASRAIVARPMSFHERLRRDSLSLFFGLMLNLDTIAVVCRTSAVSGAWLAFR